VHGDVALARLRIWSTHHQSDKNSGECQGSYRALDIVGLAQRRFRAGNQEKQPRVHVIHQVHGAQRQHTEQVEHHLAGGRRCVALAERLNNRERNKFSQLEQKKKCNKIVSSVGFYYFAHLALVFQRKRLCQGAACTRITKGIVNRKKHAECSQAHLV